ncbi:AraC family transcriptional regulator [Nocardioides caricicola]|uniref:AraC family transcriptional regulator n=1 Tax=Nocardioides caricicola TaxID=634770 RepID=A0ABW0N230_9ACTN
MSVATIPLASKPGFRTTDVEAVRAWVGASLSPHRFELLGRTRHIDVVHHRAGLSGSAFHYVDYGGDILETADLGDPVLVQIPLAGRTLIQSGPHAVIATPTMAAVTTGYTSMRYVAPNPRLVFRVERELLESRLALATGAPVRRPLRLDLAFDLTSPGGRTWRSLVDTVVADLSAGGPISQSPLASASLELAIIDSLLSVHTGAHSDLLHEQSSKAYPRALRRAMDLIEDHCAEPLTTADVAEAVGVSVRALQEAFQSHLDTTPMAYLRSARLRRVHAELVAGGEGVTVTDVALRWGITHAGRFAQDYRRTFGRSPSETLRQGR